MKARGAASARGTRARAASVQAVSDMAGLSVTVVTGLAGTGKTHSMAQAISRAVNEALTAKDQVAVILTGPTGLSVHALAYSKDMEGNRDFILFWGTLARLQSHVYNRFAPSFSAKRSTQRFRILIGPYARLVLVVDEVFAACRENLEHLIRIVDVCVRSGKMLYLIMSGDPCQLSPPDNSEMAAQVDFVESVRRLFYSHAVPKSRRSFTAVVLSQFQRFHYDDLLFKENFEAVVAALSQVGLPDAPPVPASSAEYLATRWAMNEIPAPDTDAADDVVFLCATNKAVAARVEGRRSLLRMKGRLTEEMMIRVPATVRKTTTGLGEKKVVAGSETLEFYAGEPVILLRNLSVDDGLVNGSFGVIRCALRDKQGQPAGVLVDFGGNSVNVLYIQEFEDKTEFSPKDVDCMLPIASRHALTVHKSQGQTIRQGTCVVDGSVLNGGLTLFYVAITRHMRPESVCFENATADWIAHALLGTSRASDVLLRNRGKLLDFCRDASEFPPSVKS